MNLKIESLTQDNWEQFTGLFGSRGACGNCWCMYYRLPADEFRKGKLNNGNKMAMHDLVCNNLPAGLIAFSGNIPVAWCAFAPREHFLKLQSSRSHKPIDDKPVWSVPCIFIAKEYRKQDLSVTLLESVIEYAGKHGVEIIEAYPSIPTKERLPDPFLWTGLFKSFERAGFEIVDRTSQNRPMVRFYIKK
jgi:GNAT superfamily N-acetyltransferase